MQRLHITDGDEAAEKIGALVQPEPVLPWRDMLHEGPVPGGLALEALSAERARFLAVRFRLDPARTEVEFQARDRRLRAVLAGGENLVLWFGNNLYDQLQLVQLLALVEAEGVPAARVRLAQADADLAELVPDALAALGAGAVPVSLAQLELARNTWAAFRAATPERLAALHEADASALPWLAAALERLLEELPTDYPGLSRTERYILEELEPGPLAVGELYARCRARERVPFMADWPFFALLDELAAEPSPLVAGLPVGGFPFEGGEATRSGYLGREVRVTHEGRLVREGRLDRTIVKPLDRWLGGTHLTNENVWRWAPSTATLERG